MFRLPVCPHCGTVYRYRETASILRKNLLKSKQRQDNACYHCEKNYYVSLMPGAMILALLWAAVSIGTNLLMLSRMTQLDLVAMFLVTLLYLILAAVLTPFFITFKKKEKEKKKNRR